MTILFDGTRPAGHEVSMGPGRPERTSYPERLRIHLAASRSRGLPFEDAWRLALRQVQSVKSDDLRACSPTCHIRSHQCDWLKRTFRDGYLRVGASTACVSIIAESDDDASESAYKVPRKAAA